MALPAPTYDLTARYAALQAQYVGDYVRHATRPAALGSVAAHAKHRAAAYEALAALAEQNPAFAQTLLPATGTSAQPNTLPIVPAGVNVAVDQSGAGTVDVRVDVAGTLILSVRTPAGLTLTPVLTAAATGSSATFAAPTDGLYALTITVAGQLLTTLYVPVARAAYRLLREDSRAAGYGDHPALPSPSATYAERLAILIAAEAAARTGQAALATRLLAAALTLPPASAW